MVGKILAALTGPFAIALYCVLALAAGGGAGFFIYKSVVKAQQIKMQAEKEAAEAALRPPPPPQKVPAEPEGEDPFAARYIELGEEIMVNLPQKGRVMLVQLTLQTRRGEMVEKLLKEQKMPLRAAAIHLLSEVTVEEAKRPDAQALIAERLMRAMNAEFNETYNIKPIDAILLTRYYVQ
jgi:flagellar basal body-associated protein FliL